MTNLNSETIESRLQQRLAERMEAVRGLIAARAELDAARATVNTAEQIDAAAWQTALAAGWTVGELKGSGLLEPTIKKVRKPRTKTSSTGSIAPAVGSIAATGGLASGSHNGDS